ncbi:hypothetical protein Sjap_024311 [Stephania japonica]|uniref:Uncharacterized protein n=1 Tax=Stephania japonica TaxID=461633 RepID=A0AAP0ELU0_9MAGN
MAKLGPDIESKGQQLTSYFNVVTIKEVDGSSLFVYKFEKICTQSPNKYSDESDDLPLPLLVLGSALRPSQKADDESRGYIGGLSTRLLVFLCTCRCVVVYASHRMGSEISECVRYVGMPESTQRCKSWFGLGPGNRGFQVKMDMNKGKATLMSHEIECGVGGWRGYKPRDDP